jgi:hypothetical protein
MHPTQGEVPVDAARGDPLAGVLDQVSSIYHQRQASAAEERGESSRDLLQQLSDPQPSAAAAAAAPKSYLNAKSSGSEGAHLGTLRWLFACQPS